MALSFSIENILARPTYRPIAPATVYTVVQPYPFVLTTSNNSTVSVNSGGVTLPTFSSTRKRRKRYRTIFSETQIELLEDLFRTTQYPDLYQRESVALKAGLQEERVEVWFKNRRARDRKLRKAKQSPTRSGKSEDDENETTETNASLCSDKDQKECQTDLSRCEI